MDFLEELWGEHIIGSGDFARAFVFGPDLKPGGTIL
jgi:hypothetical protein